MKSEVFAKTHNVNAFVAAIDRLRETPEDIPRMALAFSPPGLGKTSTIAWYCVNRGGVHVTAIEIMTPRWFLRTLVRELGEEPHHNTEPVFEQAAALLSERQEPLFIDEADFLIKEKISEVLRALHDITGVPIVFVGMENADKKFMRFRHLYDRFTEVIRFTPLTAQDVAKVGAEICEVELSPDASESILKRTGGNFRRVKQEFRRAERIARANGLKTVTAAELDRKAAR